jgi:hypothetical protein
MISRRLLFAVGQGFLVMACAALAFAEGEIPPSGPEAVVVDDKTAPAEAARLTRAAETLDAATRHRWAVAANTRGLRLFQAAKCEDALPLFEAAAALDKRYGMPRYNAARCFAQKGDAAAALRYLRELKALGKPQLDRLAQAQKDEAFAKITGDAGWQELFGAAAPSVTRPMGLWRALLAKKSWKLPLVSEGSDHTASEIELDLSGVHKVAGADVATLTWECDTGGTAELPSKIAVTDKGTWILDEHAEDAAVAAALKKKPGFSEPTPLQRANRRKDGLFAFAPPGHGDAICYGFGAPKPEPNEPGCGAAPCCSWICIDKSGVIGVGGIGDSTSIYGISTPIPCD